MMKYEYETLVFETERRGVMGYIELDHEKFLRALNSKGCEGWELVNVFSFGPGNITTEVTAVFKRPLAAN